MSELKTLRYTLITTAVAALMVPAASMAQSSTAERAREGSIHGQDYSRTQMDSEYQAWRDRQAERLDREYEMWASERANSNREMTGTAERAREGTIHGQDNYGDKHRADMDRDFQAWRQQQMDRLDREYETWSSERWSRNPQTGPGVEPTQTGSGATTGSTREEPVTGSGSR